MGYRNSVTKVKEDYSIITLNQVKDHLNIDESFKTDDSLLLRMIEGAIDGAEEDTSRDIVDTTCTLEIINFCSSVINVPEAPYISIESLTVIDSEDNETVLVESTDFTVKIGLIDFTIIFTEVRTYSKVTVVFRTGYVDEIPKRLRDGIIIKVADLYDIERDSVTSGLNFRDIKSYQRAIQTYIIDRW